MGGVGGGGGGGGAATERARRGPKRPRIISAGAWGGHLPSWLWAAEASAGPPCSGAVATSNDWVTALSTTPGLAERHSKSSASSSEQAGRHHSTASSLSAGKAVAGDPGAQSSQRYGQISLMRRPGNAGELVRHRFLLTMLQNRLSGTPPHPPRRIESSTSLGGCGAVNDLPQHHTVGVVPAEDRPGSAGGGVRGSAGSQRSRETAHLFPHRIWHRSPRGHGRSGAKTSSSAVVPGGRTAS